MSSAARCVNISPAGERRRRLSGWAAAAAGAIVLAGLASRGAPAPAYFATFPFAFGAAVGMLQARDRTCVVLGLQGAAETAEGGHRRLAEAERGLARAQARRVLVESTGIAAAVTLLVVTIAAVAPVVAR